MNGPAKAGTSERSLIAVVATMNGLQWLGASAVLPLLPLYLVRTHVSVALVGVVMAAYYLGGVLSQYPGGVAVDRWGNRRVIVAGFAIYGVASLLLAVSPDVTLFTALRLLQGLGSGAAHVASLGLIGTRVRAERRGSGYSVVYAAELTGMAVGPIAGNLVSLDHMAVLFAGSGALAAIAWLPLLAVRVPAAAAPAGGGRTGRVWQRPVVGALMAAVAAGTAAGVYESCWSLLLEDAGASTGDITASWTLYAVPYVLLAPVVGRLVNRYDARWLACGALTCSSIFIMIYPFVSSVPWLIALGSVEAIGPALAFPAALSLLSRSLKPSMAGRAQGLFGLGETSMIAVGAIAGGAMFAVSKWLPFAVGSVVAFAAVGAAGALWRRDPQCLPAQPATTDVAVVHVR